MWDLSEEADVERSSVADVLVVGAGPVGMTTAALLAARGVRVSVVEKHASTANDPKAISLDDESLRTYQAGGVIDDVLSVIVPGSGTLYFDSEDDPLFLGRADSPLRLGYPFKSSFAQPDLEHALRKSLDRNPIVDLQFGVELIGLQPDERGVTSMVRDTDGQTRNIRSRFVIGADGGRSRVRADLNVGMIGRTHTSLWLVVDCVEDTRNERYGMHHADPRRPHVVVPGLDGRCRYEFLLHVGESEVTTNPDFDLIKRLLAPYRSVTAEQVERAVVYRFHSLCAERWQDRGVFLVGDAAHMMPPFAGQGLNSGIRDGMNLAWKLASVIDGTAGSRLLETYEQERRPHAEAVIRSSERLGRVVMTTNERLACFRDQAIRRALANPNGRDFFEHMRYRPEYRLQSGVLAGPLDAPLVGTQIGQPRVFDFAVHQIRLLDEVLGSGWSVLGVDVPANHWALAVAAFGWFSPRLLNVPLDEVVTQSPAGIDTVLDLDLRLQTELEPARGRFVVVRPDRFVAASVLPIEVKAAGEDLARLVKPDLVLR